MLYNNIIIQSNDFVKKNGGFMSNIRKILKDYFILAFGSLILAVGINVFLVPSKISTGGVSGIGTVLYYISDIPLSVTNLVINIALFIFGFRTLPKSSLIKTLAGIFLVSFFLEVTKSWGSYNDDMLIASIFGGILVGIGVGLAVYTEASTGGSDFAALMLHKLIPHISVASFILFIDSAILIFVNWFCITFLLEHKQKEITCYICNFLIIYLNFSQGRIFELHSIIPLVLSIVKVLTSKVFTPAKG